MPHGKHLSSIPLTRLKIKTKDFPADLGNPTLSSINNRAVQKHEQDLSSLTKKDVLALAELAINLWRAKQRLTETDEKNAAHSEFKKILRPIESAIDNLEIIGVRIEDPKGKPYVPGMPLNVISSQPNTAATSDRICETLKPTIFFRDRFIQAGDVIIEGPPSPPPIDLHS
jgi:hypothetical protein